MPVFSAPVPELHGRHPYKLFKHPVKVLCVLVADALGDIGYAVLCTLQKLARPVNPYILNELRYSTSLFLLKDC